MSTSRKSWTLWTHSLVVGILSGAVAIALLSYDSSDPSFSTFHRRWTAPHNQLGYIGSWTADLLYQCFGWSSWIIPLFGAALILLSLTQQKKPEILSWKSFFSLCGLILSACLLIRIFLGPTPEPRIIMREGFLGYGLYYLARPILGKVGIFLVSVLLLWLSAVVHFEQWLESFLDTTFNSIKINGARLGNGIGTHFMKIFDFNGFWKRNKKTKIKETLIKGAFEEKESLEKTPTEKFSEPLINQSTFSENKTNKNAAKEAKARPTHQGEWKYPPTSLLTAPKPLKRKLSKSDLVETSKKIISTLKSFEVEGEMTEITPGPILTVYEFQPAPGTRIQKIHSVSTDLAMALGAPAIRIVAPIPGKSVAGIEVPNPEREEIVLRDLLEHSIANNASMKLPLCLGKDTEGKPIIEDLARMPHLLIGGATNMGKSVLVNSILTGLLCRFSPKELRLIIVDPKLVEFKIYEDIPHLLLPIVNDAVDASKALKWAVGETKRRYLKMQEAAAKNLNDYNEKADKDSELERFPYIAIIIDELAELMLTSKKDVEQSIVRLTQLARAAGLHLIMATQRPSADVVTGLIKSNCPSRASLRVASSSDSRIILDSTGAELLLGKGDMFFTSSGPMGLKRLQGSYVSDADVEKISDFWRDQGAPEYQNEILADEDDFLNDPEANRDALFNEVIAYAKEKGAISTSLIQRRFQIGYTRAARIMEQLEVAGVVGEQASAGKPRDVLI
ncbi:MAG: DNA translocase FtsK 4TM domain-containing protein [Bdellovibrionota bacterium]